MKKLILALILIFFVWVFYDKNKQEASSAGLAPGDVFYFLDTSWEWIMLNMLTFTDEGKLKLKMKFVDERMEELRKLQEKKELTEKKAKKLIEDYNKLSEQINQDLQKIQKAKENASDIFQKAKSLSEKHKSAIDNIIKVAPQKTSLFLENIKSFGENILD